MFVKASAPGKVILFGEHAVVYGKPAIALAVDKQAHFTIHERNDSLINAKILGMGIEAQLDLKDPASKKEFQRGILKYVLKSLEIILNEHNIQPTNGLDMILDIEMPIGSGLGSSAAVTVATLTALDSYFETEYSKEDIAARAHRVELEVQGAASPIDTTLSTFGGAIYLSTSRKTEKLNIGWELPLVVGYTPREHTTAYMVKEVRKSMEKYPGVINNIFKSIEQVTEEARKAIIEKNKKKLVDLININQGLLDALGISNASLSNMVYSAREAGALGSKITGAGGGGSILAYSPGKIEEVLSELKTIGNAFTITMNEQGVTKTFKEL